MQSSVLECSSSRVNQPLSVLNHLVIAQGPRLPPAMLRSHGHRLGKAFESRKGKEVKVWVLAQRRHFKAYGYVLSSY